MHISSQEKKQQHNQFSIKKKKRLVIVINQIFSEHLNWRSNAKFSSTITEVTGRVPAVLT